MAAQLAPGRTVAGRRRSRPRRLQSGPRPRASRQRPSTRPRLPSRRRRRSRTTSPWRSTRPTGLKPDARVGYAHGVDAVTSAQTESRCARGRTGLHRSTRGRRRLLPAPCRLDGDRPRPRPGVLPETRRDPRTEHGRCRIHQPPASRPFHRPRRDASLPALAVRPERHVRVVAPTASAGRIDALHDEPGFTAATLDVEPIPTRDARSGHSTSEAIRVTHTADSHAFRVSVGDGPGSSIRGIAVERATSSRWSCPGTGSSRKCRSDPARSPLTPSISTVPPSAISPRDRRRPGAPDASPDGLRPGRDGRVRACRLRRPRRARPSGVDLHDLTRSARGRAPIPFQRGRRGRSTTRTARRSARVSGTPMFA